MPGGARVYAGHGEHLLCVEACPEPLRIGAACGEGTVNFSQALDCQSGAHCQGGVCVEGVGLGQPCETEDQCDVSAYCDSVCKLIPGLGETCDFGAPCLEGACVNEVDANGESTGMTRCTGPGSPCTSIVSEPLGGLVCVNGAWVEMSGVCSDDLNQQLYSRFPS